MGCGYRDELKYKRVSSYNLKPLYWALWPRWQLTLPFQTTIKNIEPDFQSFYFSHWKFEESSLTQTLSYKRNQSSVSSFSDFLGEL